MTHNWIPQEYLYYVHKQERRKPWNITDLHNLYLKSKERAEKRQDEIKKMIKEISDEFPGEKTIKLYREVGDSKFHVLYLSIFDDTKQFPHLDEYDPKSRNRTLGDLWNDVIEFEPNKYYRYNWAELKEGSFDGIIKNETDRDKKLEFIVNLEKAIELGEKFYNVTQQYRNYLYSKVFYTFLNEMEEMIEKKYTKDNFIDKITIDIDDHKYHFNLDNSSYRVKIDYKPQYKEETINY